MYSKYNLHYPNLVRISFLVNIDIKFKCEFREKIHNQQIQLFVQTLRS